MAINLDLELGLDTFGDVTSAADGTPLPHAQVIRNVIDEAVLADSLDIDFFGLGEHHRADFAVSSPEVVLAAIAARTKRIGRGSFTESFPLFGYKLDQYEQLFEEKLDLFAALIGQQAVTWQGTLRPALNQQRVFPPIETGSLKTWVGVGGSPESVVRAARYGMPLMLAIIGGDPSRFRPYVDLYHRALGQLGKPVLPIGVHSPGHVADSDQQAREELWPDYKLMRDRIGAERGWPAMQRAEFDREAATGSLYVGSPDTVARKIVSTVKALGIARFDLKYGAGALSHEKLMRSIGLYGSEVIPRVRKLLIEDAPGGSLAPQKAV
jgi:alkanesulfonate monooxygenase SsuD/methylene tetrahydromethanopterin reductase-like flavin-dependent oxidoreductase (luciferase family)